MNEVADEEARQWRAFNLLLSTLRVRGVAIQEFCHPIWGDFKRSVSKAGLTGCLMKACFLSGTKNQSHLEI
jgi:hypothetical protein